MTRDPGVDAYIAKAQPFARAILEHVRERIHVAVPETEEALKWSMPAYLVGGKILLITAAFKAHAALNFWRGQELRGKDADSEAMGQFGKIRSLDELPPDDELDRLIRDAAELARSSPAPRKAKRPPKAAPHMHPDFAAALAKAPKAKTVLDGFPASARRDYLEWIADAKQDATRNKRVAIAVQWLSEGKRRNWQYQR